MTGETIYVYVHHLMVLFNSSAKYLWLLNSVYKYIAYGLLIYYSPPIRTNITELITFFLYFIYLFIFFVQV